MKRDQIIKNIRQNPFYVKAGVIAVLSVICFAAVYMWDNGKQVSINEQGKAVLERGADGRRTGEYESMDRRYPGRGGGQCFGKSIQ